jgi:hypothetical protein
MKNPDAILRLSALDLFVILVIASLFAQSSIKTFPVFTAGMNTIGQLLLYGWPVYIGHKLYHHFPVLPKSQYRIFTILSILFIAALALLPAISAVTELSYLEITSLPLGLVIFLAGLYCFSFTAKMLETVKYRKITDSWDSILFFFLLIILPLGVWILQPVVRRAIEEKAGSTGIEHRA